MDEEQAREASAKKKALARYVNFRRPRQPFQLAGSPPALDISVGTTAALDLTGSWAPMDFGPIAKSVLSEALTRRTSPSIATSALSEARIQRPSPQCWPCSGPGHGRCEQQTPYWWLGMNDQVDKSDDDDSGSSCGSSESGGGEFWAAALGSRFLDKSGIIAIRSEGEEDICIETTLGPI